MAKCSMTMAIVTALVFAPTAEANWFQTIKYYSDSKCVYLSAISTISTTTECTISTPECVASDDVFGKSNIESCASSLTADMGDYAYSLYYNDAACAETPYLAMGVPGYESCAITAENKSSTQNCDTAGNVTWNTCSDTTCTNSKTGKDSTTKCEGGGFFGHKISFCGNTPVTEITAQPTIRPVPAPTMPPLSGTTASRPSNRSQHQPCHRWREPRPSRPSNLCQHQPCCRCRSLRPSRSRSQRPQLLCPLQVIR